MADTYDSAGFAPVSPEAAAKADPYEAAGFSRPGSMNTEEAAKAASEAAAGGILSTVGVIPGAVGGARLGAAVAPFAGPLAPAMPVIGGLAGAGYGMWAGETARQGMGLRKPEEMPSDVRPFAYGGESFGGSVGALGFPFGAAATGFRLGETVVGKLMNRMIDSAKSIPLKFGIAEVSMAGSAATAAMSAQALFPDKAGVRIGAEVAGGMFNPSKYALSAASYASNLTRAGLESMSPAGRTTASAKLLADVFAKTGEDMEAVARVYKMPGLAGLENLTPAQKTGSVALGALEDHLAEFSGKFDMESKAKAMQGLDVLRGHIALLTNTGDPVALEAAGKVRDIYYRTLIQGRVDAGMAQAQASVGKITKDTPEARAVLSTKVREVLDTAIVDSRKAESELWGKWIEAEGPRVSGFENLKRQFSSEYDKVVKEYRAKYVPLELESFIKRVSKKGEPTLEYDPTTYSFKDVAGKDPGTTVQEMYQLRSILLTETRKAAIAGDDNSARAFSNMAESVLDDLEQAQTPAGKQMYDAARGFTREFHDAFTRSFVGKATGIGKYGDRIAPELTLRRALASGGEAGAVQLGEIEHATRFLSSRGLADEGSVGIVMTAQERFLRLAAAESINRETGKLSPDRLRKFIDNNEILLNRPGFETLKDDLGAAIKTTRNAERLEALAKRQNKLFDDQRVFAKIVKADDGIGVVQKALLSNNMERDLGKLITMVQKGVVGKDGKPLFDQGQAVNGLRSSIYAAAINSSLGKNRGIMQLDQVRALLFTPPAGQKSAMQMLKEAGLVSDREAGKINQFFGALDSIQRSQRVATAVEVQTDLTDAATAMVARMVGSGAAGAAARGVGSTTPSLIVHGAGAKFAEYMFTKLNVTTARQILIDAIADPSSGKLDLIMQQASRMTSKQVQSQAMQLNAWAVQVTAGAVGDEVDSISESFSQ